MLTLQERLAVRRPNQAQVDNLQRPDRQHRGH